MQKLWYQGCKSCILTCICQTILWVIAECNNLNCSYSREQCSASVAEHILVEWSPVREADKGWQYMGEDSRPLWEQQNKLCRQAKVMLQWAMHDTVHSRQSRSRFLRLSNMSVCLWPSCLTHSHHPREQSMYIGCMTYCQQSGEAFLLHSSTGYSSCKCSRLCSRQHSTEQLNQDAPQPTKTARRKPQGLIDIDKIEQTRDR